MNCVTIIYEERNHKYLLAFLCHIPETEEEKEAEKKREAETKKPEANDYEAHNQAQTFKDRPLPEGDIPNPDDRPLPLPPRGEGAPRDRTAPTANQRQPTFERTILNPDEKLLTPPLDDPSFATTSGAQRTSPRNVVNPDDRLLPFPPKEDKKDRVSTSGLASSAVSGKNIPAPKTESKATGLKNEVKHLGEVAGEKIHHLGDKAVEIGKRIEDKAEHIVDDIRHDKFGWVHLGVAALIIVAAIKVLRD